MIVDKLNFQKSFVINELYLFPKHERDALIGALRNKGFTMGKPERLTGISCEIITGAKQGAKSGISHQQKTIKIIKKST
ncbi:MAG: hypothetical protein ACI3XA_01945 [Clostridia bacterium]